MLSPSNRLLIYTGLIGIPLFTVLGMTGMSLSLMAGLGLLLALVVALDAPSALQLLQRITVKFPELVRTTKGREFDLDIVLTNPGLTCDFLRIGLSFPPELRSEAMILALTLSSVSERHEVRWKIKAMERGNFQFQHCYIEGASRFGLWQGRKTLSCQSEVRVYPDLSREKNVLAPLFFRRGAIGVHRVRQIGKGREFEQLREYAPGDGYEDVYWKGTAKRRFPVTKMFQMERTQEVYVAIDASRRSARRLDRLTEEVDDDLVAKTQLERFIQAALVLALAAEQQTDKFGLIIFSDKVQRLIPARSGRSHYDTIRDVLYTLKPAVVSPDYDDVFIHIGNRLRHRGLLLFLTDLGEPWLAESFVEGVSLISRRHVVLTHMLGQREVAPMFSKGDRAESDDDLYSKLAGQMMWNDFQETTRLLKQRGVHLTSSLQENLVADVVSEYLRVKKRQLI